jgi:hypothetical protein
MKVAPHLVSPYTTEPDINKLSGDGIYARIYLPRIAERLESALITGDVDSYGQV